MNHIWTATDWHLWSETYNKNHPLRSKIYFDRLKSNLTDSSDDSDIFVYLGDLADVSVTNIDDIKAIISCIKGFKIICIGNHDLGSDDYYRDIGFDAICDIATFGNLIFSHYPMAVDIDQINIHGHLHKMKSSALTPNHINALQYAGDDSAIELGNLLKQASMQTLFKFKDCNEYHDDKRGKSHNIYRITQDLSDSIIPTNMSEAYDPMNEILFDDLDQVKYWESDDDKFEDLATRTELNKIGESAANLHTYTRDDKIATAEKYGLRPVGVSGYDKETSADRIAKLEQDRLSNLKKIQANRKAQNEDTEVDSSSADYLDGPNVTENPMFGDRAEFFNRVNSFDDATQVVNFNENYIINDEDIEMNLDKWKPEKGKNILFVTGLSGSGKTTLGEKYEKEYGATLFELDGIEHVYDSSNGKIVYYIKRYNDRYADAVHNNWKDINGNDRIAIIKSAFDTLLKYTKSHSDTLFVLEGIQIFQFLPIDHFKGKPLVIKGTSATNSIIQRFKRNGNGKIDWIKELKNEFPQLVKWYLDDEKLLKKFKKSVTESAIPVLTPVHYLKFMDPINEATTKPDERLYPVYVMIIHSGTILANAIKAVTHSNFSHSCISFDSSMENMYSFGRKLDTNPAVGTFTEETIKSSFFTKRTIPYALYVIPSTKAEIKLMKKRVEYFADNHTLFKYDFIGLFKNYFGIVDNPEYKYFCSRFVADILNSGRPDNPYLLNPSLVKPEDFRKTNFAIYVTGGLLSDYNQDSVELLTNKIIKTEQLRRTKAANKPVSFPKVNVYTESVLDYQLSTITNDQVTNLCNYYNLLHIGPNQEENLNALLNYYDKLSSKFQIYYENEDLDSAKEIVYSIIQILGILQSEPCKELSDITSVLQNALNNYVSLIVAKSPVWNYNQELTKYCCDNPTTTRQTALGKVIDIIPVR